MGCNNIFKGEKDKLNEFHVRNEYLGTELQKAKEEIVNALGSALELKLYIQDVWVNWYAKLVQMARNIK